MYCVLFFSSDKSPRKRFEEYETEIIELMALNISHLLDMRFWKNNQMATDHALRLSERRFRSIYDHANVGICVCDRSGKIVMANTGLQNLYGYSEEEILKSNFYSVATSGDITEMEADLYNYEKIILGEIERYSIEKKELTSDGRLIHVNKIVSAIKNEEDEVQYTVMLTDDITTRKNNEEKIKGLNTELAVQVGKLETVNKELEAFSYSISHDLRAPLRAIDGFSKIILEDQKDDFNDESKRLLGVIIKNSGKMAMLIDDLLTFSRLSRQVVEFKPIDFGAMVDDIIEEQAIDRNSMIVEKLPEAIGEKTMMKQVFSNLIGNAVKFSSKKKKPEIKIGCEEKETCFEFYVSDNGVGFNMVYYSKIFGVFQRLHTEAEFTGTGVGLAIVQKVLEKHNGEIWAESKERKGTTFFFTLPK
jgi:PAS domain S-box-containing protein